MFWNSALEDMTDSSKKPRPNNQKREWPNRLGPSSLLSAIESVFTGGPPLIFSRHLHPGLFNDIQPIIPFQIQGLKVNGFSDQKYDELLALVLFFEDGTELHTDQSTEHSNGNHRKGQDHLKDLPDFEMALRTNEERGNPDNSSIKETQQQLHDNQTFLSSLIENIPDMIFVKDAKDLRFHKFNKAGEDLLGLSRETLLGKSDYDLFPKEEADFFTRKDREVLEGGRLVDIPEETIHTHNQGVKYLHTKKIPLLDESGEPRYLLGISQDITDRKHAELERDQRESLLNLIFETGPGCIKRVAADGTLLHMNPAGLSLVEADDEKEAIGLCVFDLVTPEHREAFERMHQEVIDGRSRFLQFEIQGMKGTRRWMETYAVPFVNPITTHTEHLAVTHDITERKKDEVRIQQLHQKNQLILSSAGEGIYGLDLEGKTTFVNPSAAKMLGYDPEELIGSPMHDTVHHSKADGSPYPKEECPMYAAFKSGELQHVDYEYLWRKDGSSFPVEYTSTSIQNDQGEVIGAVVTFKDITERKKSEEVIAQAAYAVKQKNLELALARDEALAAARSKSEFLATMSHEIRTPLNGISGMAEVLLTTEITSEQKDMLNTINNCCSSLMGLINDILDSSKMEAGKLQLECIPFDLRTLIEEVLDVCSSPAALKHLELVGLIHGNVPTALEGDPTRLRQILTNLLGNAIKFTEKGEVSLHITTLSKQADTVIIKAAVRDTGIGIEEKTCEFLFDPFQQADSSMSRKYGGTGLGLTICQQLALLMKGDIGVESTPGVGSCFWVTLPFKCRSESAQPSFIPSLQGLRACVVDDNPTHLRLLIHYMQSWGITCLTASNGKEALDLLIQTSQQGNRCDIAILDHSLPDMDVWSLGQTIKTHPELSDIPLVLLTAIGERGDARQAQAHGFVAYLSKPIRYHHFQKCLTLALEKSEKPEHGDHDQLPSIITKHTAQELEQQSRVQILLAEDNQVNQKVTIRMLASFGLRADVVENGREAIKALQAKPYQLVFMDCQMPEMDGLAATAEIRETLDPDHHIPIIALTANTLPEDQERCEQVGMDAFLEKPLSRKDLHTLLKKWVPGFNTEKSETAHQTESISIEATHRDVAPLPDLSTKRPSLDPNTIQELRTLGGMEDPEFFMSVIDQFLDDLPRHLEAIYQALDQHDAEALIKAAHTCKGSCRSIGAILLAEASYQLERHGREGDTVAAKESWEHWLKEKERTIEALSQQRPGRPS